MMKNIKIKDRIIGENRPPFIIAELSANHNQKYEIAVETIKAAKEVGADAIKFQTYTPDTITIDCNNKYFQIHQKNAYWDGMTLYELYKQAYTPWEWQPNLKQIAEEIGLICFSAPFDITAVDFLHEMNVPAYKIASLEITDIPLIKYVAAKKKPVIISTGIARINEIEEAIEACKSMGNKDIILLKCSSSYPTYFEDVNLNVMLDLKERFGLLTGISDHSKGVAIPIAATAMGATVIEKHFILDKKLGGPDAEFSLDVDEFKSMVDDIHNISKALGNVKYKLSDREISARTFCRSLFVVNNIKKGECFTEGNVKSIRPGYGLSPKHLNDVLGKRSNRNLEKGTPLSVDFIEK